MTRDPHRQDGDTLTSSSVHPLETNPHLPAGTHLRSSGDVNPDFAVQPITTAESAFRHSGWAVLRLRTHDALKRCNTNAARLDRFCNCGSAAFLYKSADGTDIAIRSNKCHDRWCLACQRERAATITQALLQVMSARTCRFATLTLRHSRTSLADQIDRLYRSFVALRRRKWWGQHVTGGGYFLEIKTGRDGLWHPHLHLILEGRYLPQRELSTEWHAVTGDSSITDVRQIHEDAEAAGYVTKYVTKPASSDVYSHPDRLDEMICALRGRRVCGTFGTWRGISLEPDSLADVEWIPVGSLDTLRSRAREGDAEAIRWMEAAARKWPLFASLFTSTPPPSS